LVLGIETATPICGVALVEGTRILGAMSVNSGTHHACTLMGMVDDLLRAVARDRLDLLGVAVSGGPGSFTGLRIGMSAGKGICLGGDLPLVTVSTLGAIAYRLAGTGEPVAVVLDARRGNVYGALYTVDGNEPVALLSDACLPLDDFLSGLPPGPVVFTGEGCEAYRDRILNAVGTCARFAPEELARPSPVPVAILGGRRLEWGRGSSADTAEPSYLRRSEAERLWSPGTS
jgi:tRNA threonylcarbamoyladenosine biosynthesis protein TsaB